MIEGFKHKKSPSERNFQHDNKLPPIIGGSVNFNTDTHQHVEDLKSGQNNILVAVRARPLSSKEHNFSNYETIRVLDGRVVILLDPQNQFDTGDIFRGNRNKEQQYAFDFAFDHTVDTETVFEKTTKFLVPGVLSGFNATTFAYGATGAGKTYTMLGGQNKPGIMYLTMMELFNQIQNNASDKTFTVKVSYMEVYNETLRDLLSSGDQMIDIREDAGKGVIVSGVTEVIAHKPGDVMDILSVGSRNRTMEATGANVVSSRSHAVLQVTVERREKNPGVSEEISQSKLSLIDLAGSERASNTNNTGQRLIEGANINRSLLALGNCITLLSEKHEKGLKSVHIPYRDSKLTRLLKDSLGGNCRTVMITNVSPAVTVFEDTYNTLKYANRAKNIKTAVARNVLNVDNHMEKYTQIINDLKNENNHLKKLLHNGNLKSPVSADVGGGFEDSGSEQKQGLINDIRQHFDEEAHLKKKVFDAETVADELEEKILDVQGSEDELQKARYDDLVNSKKKQILKTEELKRDYGYLSGKRNQIQARIQKEKNKDTVALLNSIFMQSKMHIDNMDLQQKERRVNNQMRIKDRELKFLQNQLHMKDPKSLEVSNVNYLNTPSRANSNTLEFTSGPFGQNEFDESMSFLNELNDIENSSRSNNHMFNNAKQVLHSNNNPKVMHVATTHASRKVLPPIKKLNIANHNDYGDPMPNSLHSRQPSKFYYKKQDFLVERTKPFEVNQSDRPVKKQKKAYLPFHARMKNEVLSSGRRAESSLEREDTDRSKPLRNWQLSVPATNTTAKSLNDLSHISTSSAGNNEGRMKNLRVLSKSRVVGRYGNVALRYGASPYVGGKPKNKKR